MGDGLKRASAAARATQNPPRRRQEVPGCKSCADNVGEGFPRPYHDASPRCESGGRTHCTCDTCF